MNSINVKPGFRYSSGHPFLHGARKHSLGVPTVHKTKSGKVLPATRLIAPGSDRELPKTFGKREQERAARRMKK